MVSRPDPNLHSLNSLALLESHSLMDREVVGSNPTRGVHWFSFFCVCRLGERGIKFVQQVARTFGCKGLSVVRLRRVFL